MSGDNSGRNGYIGVNGNKSIAIGANWTIGRQLVNDGNIALAQIINFSSGAESI